MGFSRQEYWSGLPFPSPGDLPDPGIEPGSPALEADTLTSAPPGKINLWLVRDNPRRRCRFDPWVGKISWEKGMATTPVFLPGEFHGQRSLLGYSPWESQREGHDWETNTHTRDNQFSSLCLFCCCFPLHHTVFAQLVLSLLITGNSAFQIGRLWGEGDRLQGSGKWQFKEEWKEEQSLRPVIPNLTSDRIFIHFTHSLTPAPPVPFNIYVAATFFRSFWVVHSKVT